ncbi:MAG: YceI family protein [Bacteroidota bacterium]
MKKLLPFILTILLANVDLTAQSTWVFDQAHTSVGFSIEHLVISETTGQFTSFEGTVEASNEDFTDAQINFSVDVSSIDTGNERRDGHLKSDDFFNAEDFPKMTFKGTTFEKVEGNTYKLIGDLTIRDVTKSIELEVIYKGTAQMGDTQKAGFKLTGSLNRFDYNLKWSQLTEAGGLVVGEEVTLTVNVELNQQA